MKKPMRAKPLVVRHAPKHPPQDTIGAIGRVSRTPSPCNGWEDRFRPRPVAIQPARVAFGNCCYGFSDINTLNLLCLFTKKHTCFL
ncbi:hypothetical protein GTA51_13505 [Desulfovibrio aerotolerans]|uniref:Uncharacterized protein n=1 Tax=Solidesulfovibrio aerotolerans TaxID=295255 RepID=A0A7C9IMP4_9BACT|nr:hypothetical protein [Solidesulfovibrio aerotolerans]MYL84144.1 hypothetical protein [Solidesulfovibrio aerotolerans]